MKDNDIALELSMELKNIYNFFEDPWRSIYFVEYFERRDCNGISYLFIPSGHSKKDNLARFCFEKAHIKTYWSTA